MAKPERASLFVSLSPEFFPIRHEKWFLFGKAPSSPGVAHAFEEPANPVMAGCPRGAETNFRKPLISKDLGTASSFPRRLWVETN
jgi:hypothetical protein